jgi:hypothetical protein
MLVFWMSIIALALAGVMIYLGAVSVGLAMAAADRLGCSMANPDVLDRLAVDDRAENLYREISRSGAAGQRRAIARIALTLAALTGAVLLMTLLPA